MGIEDTDAMKGLNIGYLKHGARESVSVRGDVEVWLAHGWIMAM